MEHQGDRGRYSQEVRARAVRMVKLVSRRGLAHPPFGQALVARRATSGWR